MCLTVKISLQSAFLFPNYLAIFFSYLLIFVLFALQSGFLFYTYLTIFFFFYLSSYFMLKIITLIIF